MRYTEPGPHGDGEKMPPLLSHSWPRQVSLTGAGLLWCALAPSHSVAVPFVVANSVVGLWYQHAERRVIVEAGVWQLGRRIVIPTEAANAVLNAVVHVLVPAVLVPRAWARWRRRGARRRRDDARRFAATVGLGVVYLALADLPRLYPSSRRPLAVYAAAHAACLVATAGALLLL